MLDTYQRRHSLQFLILRSGTGDHREASACSNLHHEQVCPILGSCSRVQWVYIIGSQDLCRPGNLLGGSCVNWFSWAGILS